MKFKIQLNNFSGVPYYKQIVNQITYAIVNGILKPGSQLPTVRQLAVELQVNLNTVAKAYKELEIKGIVDTYQGTGTFISNKKINVDGAERTKLLKIKCTYFIDELANVGIDINEALNMLKMVVDERRKNYENK